MRYDGDKIKELLIQARYIYNSAQGRMPGLEQWANSRQNSDREIALLIYNFFDARNSHAETRIFGFDNLLEQEILEALSTHKDFQ